MAENAPRKSRFDQTEPEPPPPRRSRFDQRERSRSPRRSNDPDNHRQRTRSPPASASPDISDAAARAREAAARLTASIAARKAANSSSAPMRPSLILGDNATKAGAANPGDIYQQDGDYIKDIEVNDLRNRYTLTKGATQKMIKELTGADVTTRGEYYPDKNMATPSAPPLYLHITSQTKEGLEQAVAKIEELMKQELPNLVDERRFRRTERTEQFERDEKGRRKWPEERLPIDMEPIPGFNLRAQVVGAGGAYVKHIQQESDCRVQIKGRGSGFIESSTGMESDEPMYLHITGSHPDKVAHAKGLCMDLLKSVKANYDSFKERGPSRSSGRDGYGHSHGQPNDGYYGGSHGRSYSSASNGNIMSPGTAQAATPTSAGGDYAAQWAAYYSAQGGDPFAAYGGYEAYMRLCQQYYYSQPGADSSVAAAAPGSTAPPGPPAEQPPPPPPPPTDTAPPPPPPGGPGPTNYSQVPPPPGM